MEKERVENGHQEPQTSAKLGRPWCRIIELYNLIHFIYICVVFISELFELLASAPSARGTAEGKVRILQHRHSLKIGRLCPVTDSHCIKPYHNLSQTLECCSCRVQISQEVDSRLVLGSDWT